MPTMQELFDAFPSKFRPENAQGVDAIIQYDITGDQPGVWQVAIKNGTCTVTKGTLGTPKVTFTMSTQVRLAIAEKKITPQAAFAAGQLKISGDFALASKLNSYFNF